VEGAEFSSHDNPTTRSGPSTISLAIGAPVLHWFSDEVRARARTDRRILLVDLERLYQDCRIPGTERSAEDYAVAAEFGG
jgi:hypothetical protein